MLDWVYQEELYGRGNFKGYWWQPDGDQIAFLELDESPLKPFVVMDHLPIHGKSESTNYPKAGDANPLVRVGVISAADPQTVHWVDLSAYKDQERRECGDLVARRIAADVANSGSRADLVGAVGDRCERAGRSGVVS